MAAAARLQHIPDFDTVASYPAGNNEGSGTSQMLELSGVDIQLI
jgi:hypothetical protein